MTDLEKMENRLANAELAIFALSSVIMQYVPAVDIHELMGDFHGSIQSNGQDPVVDFQLGDTEVK